MKSSKIGKFNKWKYASLVKVSSLRQDMWYLGITNLYQNTQIAYLITNSFCIPTYQSDLLHLLKC